MLTCKDKSKWKICRELVKKSQEVVAGEKIVQEEINEILLPLLKILEEEEIIIERVWWKKSLRSLDLMPEVCLSVKAFQRILNELPVRKTQHHFNGGQSVLYFYLPLPSNCFSIYNGGEVCPLKKTLKEVTIPASTTTQVVWEPIGSCTQIEALTQMIEEKEEEGE